MRSLSLLVIVMKCSRLCKCTKKASCLTLIQPAVNDHDQGDLPRTLDKGIRLFTLKRNAFRLIYYIVRAFADKFNYNFGAAAFSFVT